MRAMSFCTSFSSNLRPIRRLIAESVFLGLVTACRLAGAPTRISPSSMYATMEGVVRAPSEFSITLGLPPSMIATQELVVPRSIPMIFPMAFPFEFPANNLATDMGINPSSSSLGVLGPSDGDQRRPNHAVVQRVALLQHIDHRVRLLLRWEHADGLMSVRVEFLPDRVDLLDIGLLEYRAQLLQGQVDSALQSLKGGGIRGKRRFQTVLDGKQLGGERLDRVFVGVCKLDLCPLADIVGLGLGPEPGVVVLLRLQFRLSQQLPGVGDSLDLGLLAWAFRGLCRRRGRIDRGIALGSR